MLYHRVNTTQLKIIGNFYKIKFPNLVRDSLILDEIKIKCVSCYQYIGVQDPNGNFYLKSVFELSYIQNTSFEPVDWDF